MQKYMWDPFRFREPPNTQEAPQAIEEGGS